MNSQPLVEFGSAPFNIIDGDRGKNYPKQDEFYGNGYCLFLSAANVTSNGFDFSSSQFISEHKDNLLRKGKLKRGDVVLTTRGTIGNVGYYNGSVPFENLRINSGMVIFRCESNKLLPAYLYHFLRSPQFHGQVNSLRSGVAQPQLPIRDMKHIKMPIPRIDKQKTIINILSTYDNLIENNRRRIQLLERSARLFYKEWFVHLRFPDHEHVKIKGGVPEGWHKKIALEVMDVLSGGTPKTQNQQYWNGHIPFYTPKDSIEQAYVFTTEKTITEEGLHNCNSKLYPKNTIFITARGTVGKINLAQTDMAMNQSCYALVSKHPINQYFLYFALLEAVQQFRSRAVGAVFDAIIIDTFKLISFLIPDEKIIELYTEQVKTILNQVDILTTQNRLLSKARDLLLPKLMNGEIPV